jgi:hypothetical protein
MFRPPAWAAGPNSISTGFTAQDEDALAHPETQVLETRP